MSSAVWFPGKMCFRQKENQDTVPEVVDCLANIRSWKEACEGTGRDKVRRCGSRFSLVIMERETKT